MPDEYRPNPAIPRNLTHFLDRGSVIALDAALQALAHAGVGAGAGDARRFALVDGLPYRAPGQAAIFVPYGHLVARALGVRGPVTITAGHEASGASAIVAAANLVREGVADVVIAGAAQGLQRPLLDHLYAQGFATRTGAHPFDARHDGFAAAEAAAYVVIESEPHAMARGGTALARIAGAGAVFDPSAEPLELSGAPEAGRAMQAALADAGYLQNQVDLVVSCADGRPASDFAEGYGLRRTFGRHAYFAGVTTVAGALGFALAASAPLSAAMAIEAMARQQSFPIAGFETAEQDLELAYAAETKEETVGTVLVTSLGAGGTNVALVLERC
ncbi:MAG: hypothetical protein IT303_12350 [Dehalococcoidia bacterium]|nr:hypothetical protein [Dehalococcoidia bacterium]